MRRDPLDPEGQYDNSYCAEECGYGVSFTKRPPRKNIADMAVELIRERQEVGTETYGRPLFHDYKTLVEWLTDAIEEQADELKYLLAARESAKELMGVEDE